MSVRFLVVAKAPVPGAVKTRLTGVYSPHEAAALAGAALLDTLDVVADAAHRVAGRAVVALSGDLAAAAVPSALATALDRFTVIGQRDGDLGERLAAAHHDAAIAGPGARTATVQIGMDTPQVTVGLLTDAADRLLAADGPDAVLGPASDGGWWLLGLRDADHAAVLAQVEMSTPDTGADTERALRAAGLRVELLAELRDVDDPADVTAVVDRAPHGRFAALARTLHAAADGPGRVPGRPDSGADGADGASWSVDGGEPAGAYERGLDGAAVTMRTRDGEILDLAVARWQDDPGAGDEGLLARCLGPTLDVGCGPGRMTAALTGRGVPCLGVDVSGLAVRQTLARGGPAVHGDIFDQWLTTGPWQHVLLADGNVGIGGDPVRMLWRCRELLHPEGSVLLDVDLPGTSLRRDVVQLVDDGGRHSGWFWWARMGREALPVVAQAAGLAVHALWSAPGGDGVPRWQAELVASPRWSGAATR